MMSSVLSFTMEGSFVGSGGLKSYVDERVNWFDGIQTETWSTLWFEDFVEQLGYEMSPRFKFIGCCLRRNS